MFKKHNGSLKSFPFLDEKFFLFSINITVPILIRWLHFPDLKEGIFLLLEMASGDGLRFLWF